MIFGNTPVDTGPVAMAKALPHVFSSWASAGRRQRFAWTDYLGRHIAKAIAKGNGRLIVNVPPQHGKSTFIAEDVPAWFLWKWPWKSVIVTSHGQELANRSGRNCRNLIRDAGLPGLSLRDDSTSAKRWNTEDGGQFIAAGFGGSVTGNPGHLILVDDPYKSWAQAHSKKIREAVQDWFLTTLYQRQQQDTTIIVLSTRWHRDDLCGYLLQKHEDPWECVRFPALAEAGDALGRAPGDALCPERYTREKLEDIRRGMPSEAWDAIYQQAPNESLSVNVYRNFSDANIMKDLVFNPRLPLHVSMDFNVNPGMHIELGQYDQVNDIAYCIDEIHGPRMHLEAALDALERRVLALNGTCPKSIEVYGDASGESGTIGDGQAFYDRVRAKLKKLPIPFRMCVSGSNPPIVERVMAMNDRLRDSEGKHRYFVHDRCVRLINDFREMRNGADGMPDKSDRALSHASEAEGYRCYELVRSRAWASLRPGRVVTAR